MKSSIFWDITPCSSVKVNLYDVARVSSACCLFHDLFLLDLFFKPEDVDYMFLWNVCCLSPVYTASYPRRRNSPIWLILKSRSLRDLHVFIIVSSTSLTFSLFLVHKLFFTLITAAERSEAQNVFSHSGTGIVGSNTSPGMDVCLRFFC
jgi:hypothetical protein